MISPKMSKSSAVRSPTLASSSELTSIASPRSGRNRRRSSAVEPFPPLESEGTISTAESAGPHIPHTTLLSSSAPQQQSHQRQAPSGGDAGLRARPLEGKRALLLQSQADRTDALWAEMQATLADVELSASRGTHFFGSKHSAALEELRTAQMALAQAWTRGEDGSSGGGGGGGGGDDILSRQRSISGGDADSDRSPGASIRDGDLADADVEAAWRRREANDRYFSRIEQGVVDVVAKLDGVAQAMGKVERESREIWSSESEDLDSSSP